MGNEGDEGNEGGEHRRHDRDAGLRLRRRDLWPEDERREGRDRGHCHRRGRSVEEKWFFQARWRVEPETQEETCPTCSQGCEPIHQGAVRVQGEASEQDCQGSPNEEAEGDDQLRCSCGIFPVPRWADSPGILKSS